MAESRNFSSIMRLFKKYLGEIIRPLFLITLRYKKKKNSEAYEWFSNKALWHFIFRQNMSYILATETHERQDWQRRLSTDFYPGIYSKQECFRQGRLDTMQFLCIKFMIEKYHCTN